MPNKKNAEPDASQIHELLLQALETELGGVKVYETALRCVVNDGLKDEWEKYLEQTREHVEIVSELMDALGLDPEAKTPGRTVVQQLGTSLVEAMETALDAGNAAAAEIVACECVVLAETKDHANWELIGELVKSTAGESQQALEKAWARVEDEEDEHLYHTKGWARELWLQSLALPAVLPPPEERKNVKSAIGAARAKHQRADMA